MNELNENSKIINCVGEFSDKNLEKEFFQQDMQNAIWFIKLIVITLGVLNTLFIIPDYLLINNIQSFIIILIARIFFVCIVIILIIRLKFVKNYRKFSYWITIYEIIAVSLFLFVFYQYETPNYLIQSFGVMVIILSVFMVPNRWINTLVVTLLVSTGFIIMSAYYIKEINSSEFYAGLVYIYLSIFLCSIIAFRNQYYKRNHYFSNKELIRISTTDHLSGAYNRTKLNKELNMCIQYSIENEFPLSLTFLDFDNFKKINDIYGHLVGDSVIIESSNLIRGIIRETDIFARWGGEEFVIIFPNTDINNALEIVERIRIKIANHKFTQAGNVTCSFGVVQLASEDTINNFLLKADRMLYAAKKAGKNTVITELNPTAI